ncbi:FKBP-type peptidyl-prolyl cis-trans isomerase [Bacteroides intestinalis]|jgi:FKBP-type peptidyl-prolyl cis-trans isomerase FklB|uniref:FKBP-type peptidyl-prolyl cis-trans isomerase n=1 Tax=Bacteroides intestinalis TaxID=329854 RepID=UPI00189C79CD|nr:FKBP-type peptidyl-prolyl cis-trans isomerase [Bacteroides intestinalis]
MNKKLLVFLPFLLILAGAFVSCEEVEEEGKYANWQERNQAFLDSIKVVAGDNYVPMDLEKLDKVEVGEMFYVKNEFVSTLQTPEYIYCKKLVKNLDGQRPMATEAAYVYYYGTLITGTKFDGSFTGYSAIDQAIPNPPKNEPTDFDWTVMFTINSSSLTSGWRTFLQYMRVGERWMVYIPWGSAYGTDGSGSIPGYSVLAFDVIMTEVVQ